MFAFSLKVTPQQVQVADLLGHLQTGASVEKQVSVQTPFQSLHQIGTEPNTHLFYHFMYF